MKQLEQELRERIGIDEFMQLRSLLLAFKERGGSSVEATQVLERLRAEHSPDYPEDRILELLDVTTGWCSPRLRIW